MTTLIRMLIGGGLGLLGGAALGYLGKCSSGTCPLTASPLRGAIFGVVIGVVLALLTSAIGRRKEDS